MQLKQPTLYDEIFRENNLLNFSLNYTNFLQLFGLIVHLNSCSILSLLHMNIVDGGCQFTEALDLTQTREKEIQAVYLPASVCNACFWMGLCISGLPQFTQRTHKLYIIPICSIYEHCSIVVFHTTCFHDYWCLWFSQYCHTAS